MTVEDEGLLNNISENLIRSLSVLLEDPGLLDKIQSESKQLTNNAANIASAGEEMGATIVSIGQNVQNTIKASSAAKNLASEGSDVIDRTLTKINEVDEILTSTSLALQALLKTTEQAGRSVKVVSDISSKTDLLALNASIEAARAGSAGKGFAVVAQEVGRLSEKTQTSISEIETILRNIPENVNEVSQRLEKGVGTAKNSVKEAAQAKHSIAEIVKLINSVDNEVSNIGEAIRDQGTAITNIAVNIDYIEDRIRDENTIIRGGTLNSAPPPAPDLEVVVAKAVEVPVAPTSITAPLPIQKRSTEVEKPQQALAEVLRIPLPLVSGALNNIWEIFLIRNQIGYLFDQERPMLKERTEFLQSWEFLDTALKRNVSELENALMAMRLNNLKPLYGRMEKLVRSYLDEHKEKKVEFLTAGESMELDKKVIDVLGEPLIHLIRNSLDHGIETADMRVKLGKPPCGTLRLSTELQADQVLVKIQDDGNGIDGAKLIEKARGKKIDVTPYLQGISPVEIIFLPGFSTAEKVTDVSGRGIGMDAVRHSVGELGGSIEIDTEVGMGTTFSIYLPLSLSVVPAALFRVNSEIFGAHINSVLEVCRVRKEELKQSNGQTYFLF
ncbi:methyl-accepting chemotaxis protein [Bdellovibrionota bacterium FG-1]